VLLCIKGIFVFRELPVDHCNNLEVLPIEIRSNFLASLRIYRFSHFVLIGDFSINMNNPDHPLYSKVCNIMEVFSLTQVVSECTHSSQSGNSSLIDLALVPSPPQSVTCTTIPPLANSDHNGLKLTASHKTIAQHLHTKRRTVWQYAHADFSKANRMISQTDWDSLYCEDIDQIAYSGKTCTCRSWNSASQKKFYHLNVVIDHGSTSPYPSLFEGKMLHSKELRMPTAQDYGCNTNASGREYHPNSALLKRSFSTA